MEIIHRVYCSGGLTLRQEQGSSEGFRSLCRSALFPVLLEVEKLFLYCGVLITVWRFSVRFFSSLLCLGRSPDSFPRGLEYLPVEDEDDKERDVEGGAGGEDLIGDVLADETALLQRDAVQVVGVLPAELRRQGHDERHAPNQHDHGEYPPLVARVDIVDVSHGPVSEIQIKPG